MKNSEAQKKPRIFELWDLIFSTDTQEDDAAHQGGNKKNDRR